MAQGANEQQHMMYSRWEWLSQDEQRPYHLQTEQPPFSHSDDGGQPPLLTLPMAQKLAPHATTNMKVPLISPSVPSSPSSSDSLKQMQYQVVKQQTDLVVPSSLKKVTEEENQATLTTHLDDTVPLDDAQQIFFFSDKVLSL